MQEFKITSDKAQMSEVLPADFIEENICKVLDAHKKTEFTPENLEMNMRLMMSNMKVDINDKDCPFLFKVMVSKLEAYFKFKVPEDSCKMLICFWAETPGSLMMYLWYIQWWLSKTGHPEDYELTKEVLGMRIFPMGTFDRHKLSEAWEKQKVVINGNVGNAVDNYMFGRTCYPEHFKNKS